MTENNHPKVLVIHPPLRGLGRPPRFPALLANRWQARIWDANLDFYKEWVLSPERLRLCLEKIKAPAQPMEGLPWRKWSERAAGADAVCRILRGEEFYDIQKCLGALQMIYDFLSLYTQAYAPACLAWEGFAHPQIRTWNQALGYCRRGPRETNPFPEFYEQRLGWVLSDAKPDWVLIPCSGRGQSLPGLTLAAMCRRMRPEMKTVLLSDHLAAAGPPARAPKFWDHLAPLSRLASLEEMLPPRGEAIPDFSALPWREYLSPGAVFSWPPDCPGVAQVAEKVDAHGIIFLGGRLPAELPDKEPRPALAVRKVLNRAQDPQALMDLARAGVRLIVWQYPNESPPEDIRPLRRALLDAAKADLWSHVILPGRASPGPAEELAAFLEENPNLGLSWTCLAQAGPFNAPQPECLPPHQSHCGPFRDLPVMEPLRPLPGRPAWQGLDSLGHLLLLVQRLSRRGFLRLRQDQPGGRVRVLGQELEYFYQAPADIPPERLEEIALLIASGGETRLEWLMGALQRAFIIGYAMENGLVVATYTLKTPRPQYIEMVQGKTGVDLTGHLERGYLSVRPEYRGLDLTGVLGAGLTEHSGGRPMFMVAGSDNQTVNKWCRIMGNTLAGSYFSDRLNKEVSLWLSPVAAPDRAAVSGEKGDRGAC